MWNLHFHVSRLSFFDLRFQFFFLIYSRLIHNTSNYGFWIYVALIYCLVLYLMVFGWLIQLVANVYLFSICIIRLCVLILRLIICIQWMRFCGKYKMIKLLSSVQVVHLFRLYNFVKVGGCEISMILWFVICYCKDKVAYIPPMVHLGRVNCGIRVMNSFFILWTIPYHDTHL